MHCVGCDSVKRFPAGRVGNRREAQMEGEQGDVNKRGYRLWCDKEDVVEGLVIGGAGVGADTTGK